MNFRIILSGFIFLTLLLLACAPKTQGPLEKPEAKPAITGEQNVSGGSEWDRLASLARKEGKLSIYATPNGEFRVALIKRMREKFGIEVQTVNGRGGELAPKILSERKAGIYNVDVYLGGKPIVIDLKPHGVFDPLSPQLFLPEVLDPKAWWGGDLNWIDKDKQVLAMVANPSSALAVNTKLVGKDEIKSYLDLLNPKWKDKIIFNDPTTPGVSEEWFVIIASKIMNLDYIRKLSQMGLTINRDQRLQVEWLAQGKFPIAIAPQQSTVGQFRKDGAPLELITPAEGTNLTSSSGNMAIMNKAPHPNAAKLFVNWILTREGQSLFSETVLFQSARVDVPTSHLDDFTVRKPDVKYFSSSSEEFVFTIPEYHKIAVEILAPLRR